MMMRAEVYFYFTTIILNYCLLTSGQNAEAQCVWSDCGARSCNDEAYPHEWATATCEENFQCLSGSRPRLYCCEVPSPYIDTFWSGTAPFCGASCNDCKDQNSECIISQDDCGDGVACLSGSKTLCGVLHPSEALKKIPLVYWIVIAVVLVLVGLGSLFGIACCIGCYCCANN